MIKSFNLSKAHFSKLLFFLIIFFLPQQFGPHFWPPFSKVSGIRVDYLSPTIYVSDILIILLFLSSRDKVVVAPLVKSFFQRRRVLLLTFVLIIPLLYTKSPMAVFYGLTKLIEFLYLGLYIATQIKKGDIKTIVEIFAIVGLLESILAIAQFLKQGSIGEVLYFFGERYYHLSTIGVAVINTAKGLMVRPYGTFPHPNILAFFLFTSIVLTTYQTDKAKKKIEKYLLIFSFAIMQAGLLLTFSRVILLCDLLFLIYVFFYLPYSQKKINHKRVLAIISIIAMILIYLLFFNLRFLNYQYLIKDIFPRQDLAFISLKIIKTHPFFGVGLNNFYYYEEGLQMNFSPIYLQPVHNILLLWIANTGLIGGAIFLYFLKVSFAKLVDNVKKSIELFSFSKTVLVIFLSIFFVGLFDHFFLTTQQGQLMVSIVIGFAWSKA